MPEKIFTKRTTFLVLGLLSDKSMTGFGIKRHVEEEMSFFWSESFGQIYPTLKRLLKEKYLKQRVTQKNGIEKKIYSITESGEEYLREWLTHPSVRIPQIRNEILLKVFFSKKMSKKDSINILDTYRKKLIDLQTKLTERNKELLEAQRLDKDRIYQRISILNGLAFCEAEIKWTILSSSLLKNI